MLDVDLFYARPRPFVRFWRIGQPSAHDGERYIVFFLVTVRLCNACICLTGPKYRQSTLHSLCSKTSAQPEDARFDKYGHPWIYPLDGVR